MNQIGVADRVYAGWQDLYRDRWEWDAVYWGTHCVDCYPGNCPLRVYVRNGLVWREEQAGTFPTIEERVPDFNPMGCQKGVSWSQSLYGPDRLLYPLKRAGERGEGKWTRVSWDDALTDIADSIIDAIEEEGPESIIKEGTPEVGSGGGNFFGVLGATTTDLNASINDFSIGLHETFGKFNPVSTADDWFHAELILIWHMNPVFTRIPFYHFIAEARYNGAEVVNISPDINPSHTHADYQIPIEGATDAAFGLSLVQVMLEEDLAHRRFIQEQTDLGYLVRLDTRKYLRQTDVEGDGREDQMYQWVPDSGLKLADRGNMLLGGVEIALDGTYDVPLADGSTVQVRPALALLREKLDAEFTPEKQQAITGVHPDTVRMLARKVATRKTAIMLGYNACKFYHGDLIERAMALVLAVSGNWGKQGTGARCWAAGLHDGAGIAAAKPGPGAQNTELVLAAREAAINEMKKRDPTMTTEIAIKEMSRSGTGVRDIVAPNTDPIRRFAGGMVPAFFFWYWHAGFRERWNKREWGDESLPRDFDEYFDEALSNGWWDGLQQPAADVTPRVLIECGGNMLRRTRGGKTALLESLWPKLRMIVTIDFRISQTALYADYVLPAAQHYEKIGFGIPTPHVLHLTFSDRAAKSPGEARTERDIYLALLRKIEERTAARGIEDFERQGERRRFDDLVSRFTQGGQYRDEEHIIDEGIRDSALAGTLPPRTTIETFRDKGHVRFIDLGLSSAALSSASPIERDKTFVPFRNQVESGHPFPTYARRAQFYIDHDWFMEAGEELPTYKPNPNMGGDYPIGMTSGHNRWSIHAMNQANKFILGTHRGEPHVMVNPDDATARGVEDDDLIRVFNDLGEFHVRAKTAPNVRRGQLISYNGWAGFQYAGWNGANEIEPGMVKWIGLAGGYGHLRYAPIEWQPVPVDRWVRCDFAKLEEPR